MDAAQLYAFSLTELGDTLVVMTSPQWDDALQELSSQQRSEAAQLMISTERARLTLGNTALQAIADQLKKNEDELTTGINNLEKALAALTNVTQTLTTLSGVLKVVGRIVSLA